MNKIIIKGAREHNLKNIDVELPRDQLVVISGLSGSGKSSLAFDTIFAEGQRRYVESLSSYARMFLGRMEKPDLDYIEGLSPAISIEQKTTHRNPRSTVGTVTEIYDYFRLLFARIGVVHCPQCGREIHEQSVDQILDVIYAFPDGTKMTVLAPMVYGKKGEHEKLISDASKAGFARIRLNGEIRELSEPITLDKKKKHSIDIVVDRIKKSQENKSRISEAVETAVRTSGGRVIVSVIEDGDKSQDYYFSEKNSCPDCNISIPELQPRLFSFNNPYGACPSCAGLGITMEYDEKLIMPDMSLSYNEGGILPFTPKSAWYHSWFDALAEKYHFSLDTPLKDLPKKVMNILLYGSDDVLHIKYTNREGNHTSDYNKPFPGIFKELERRHRESFSDSMREYIESFMSQRECTACHGARLRPEALAVTIGGKNIEQLTSSSVQELKAFFDKLKLSETEKQICGQIMKEIKARLQFLDSVGLGYLTLNRKAATLSGGEAQRIRLATQIGSSLVGVLYILDEPTIGLHQRDNEKLIDTLKHLRDIGNTLIVVEHDEQTIRAADYVVELGPGAGVHGGSIVAQGTVKELLKNKKSITARFLNGDEKVEVTDRSRVPNSHCITIKGAKEHNLKNIDVKFPLGKLVVVTGVSGSGKSSLVNDILFPAAYNRLNNASEPEGAYKSISGLEYIDKIINIDQSAIGRTPRSNPATYVEVFGALRQLFAEVPEAKAKGYKAGRFSFNVKGGRCENCEGGGTIKIEMHFLPDVYITCDVCGGKRFNRDTLEIRYKGKNIYEVLEMTVEEACIFFKNNTIISRKLCALRDVGLGYIKLGQSALTLSGGEAQRVKLAYELSKVSTGKTLYILDEPTTGLHFADVKQLMEVIEKIVAKGNSVVIIEHNMDVIKMADYIIDLGPEGGTAGGTVVATGTPEEIASCPDSYTGRFLKEMFHL